MKKTILALMLIFSQPALALWTNIEDKDTSEMHYVDLDTMKVEGDIVTVWTYVDFEKTQKKYIRSISTKSQFDCKNEMSRELFIAIYKENKLKGKPHARGEVKDKWEVVAPYTMGGKVMRTVCGEAPSNQIGE